MSYEKNTYNFSQIDSIIYTLESLKHSYTLIEIGKVKGFGCNDLDIYFGDYTGGIIKYYTLRKLQFKDKIFLEQMHRTYDCDSDDTIMSHEFTLENQPEEWYLEVYDDYEGFVDIRENEKEAESSSKFGEQIYRNKP